LKTTKTTQNLTELMVTPEFTVHKSPIRTLVKTGASNLQTAYTLQRPRYTSSTWR